MITPSAAAELIGHEAIVKEAYRDSVGVWTWGIGVTNASGHQVYPRYLDKPQPVRKCLEIFVWLLRERYAPAVEKAFAGHALNEAQFAAALSFHYNTGRILSTDWVGMVRDGKPTAARKFLETHYTNGGMLAERRKKEAALFFDGFWTTDGKATVFPVAKPSYRPIFSKGRRVEIMSDLEALLA